MARSLTLPDLPEPLLIDPMGQAMTGHADGAVRRFTDRQATLDFAQAAPRLLINQRLSAARLGLPVLKGVDILELWAFVRPAQFLVPTLGGLTHALGLDGRDHEAARLIAAARRLLGELAADDYRYRAGAHDVARALEQAGWPWAPHVTAALQHHAVTGAGMAVWNDLAEWQDGPPPSPPTHHPITADAIFEQLESALGPKAEVRPGQTRYAKRAGDAFQPAVSEDDPHIVLAEAGTGTGKTLGYLAPAALWSRTNKGTVWLSTYTRNLQRQIDQELDRLYPDPADKRRRSLVRKGRENYLCLLNYEDRLQRAGIVAPAEAPLLGLVARWARFSRDGDLVGGDFPSWLAGLFGPARIAALADRRGECLYSACRHYKKCYVERTIRRAKTAEMVVANHALVMAQAVHRAGEPGAPTRIVFDEGHHLFAAADAAFAVVLSGREAAELRRWIRGSEGTRGRRGRGLAARIDDLIIDDGAARTALDAVLAAATALPGGDWRRRLAAATPHGPAETLLSLIRTQIFARQGSEAHFGHTLEIGTESPIEGLLDAVAGLGAALDGLKAPMVTLAARLAALHDREEPPLDTPDRTRLEAVMRGLARRGELVTAWQAMLADLGRPPPDSHVDWFELERIDGQERDVAVRRHWLDPTEPLAEAVFKKLHGALITSATLRDRASPDDPDAAGRDWQAAEMRTGAQYLVRPARRIGVESPFDHAAQTRIFIIQDVDKQRPEAVAGAMAALMRAAGGGAIGLFTAIERLRRVHGLLNRSLNEAGLALYAQHVDPIDITTLIDIFRAEENSCLLGTDAVRDGVDVPGRSLRLLIFDRVPWPRPSLLHRARRSAFTGGNGRTYDEMLTRAKLAQAYGRLIRRRDDCGVFVILDRQTPTRLLSAFPAGVPVIRSSLARATLETERFLAQGLERASSSL